MKTYELHEDELAALRVIDDPEYWDIADDGDGDWTAKIWTDQYGEFTIAAEPESPYYRVECAAGDLEIGVTECDPDKLAGVMRAIQAAVFAYVGEVVK